MGLIVEDCIKDTTTTVGTGAVTLAGTVINGYRPWNAVCSVNDTGYYAIRGTNADGSLTGEWETGLGTYSAANTLTRTKVINSSNAGAAVSFSAGTKQVSMAFVAVQAKGSLPVLSVLASSVGSQAAATALIFGVNLISNAPNGPGWSVKLPAATGSGKRVGVKSLAPFFVIVYPQTGEAISFFSANTAYAIYPTTYIEFVDTGTGQWELAYNLASIFPVAVGLVAHAGGGQGSATPVGYGASVLGTVATDGDSALAPIALGAGEFVAIINKGAKRLDVFPVSGGNFQGYAANEPLSVLPGKTILLLDEGPPNEWAGSVMGDGYALPFITSSSLSTPANATTYFTGIGLGPLVTEAIQKIRVPQRGRVRRIQLSILILGSTGTAELSTMSFRLNATTDTAITAAINGSSVYQEFDVAMDIPVARGDAFEIKWVTPTWVTKPTGVIINGVVYIS